MVQRNTLKIEHKKNYAIIQIDNGKVNAINTEFAKELGEAFKELEEAENTKGIILTGRPNCFSAGLDVTSLATGGTEGLRNFWTYYLGTLQRIIRCPKPVVGAITGYAQAGTTVLALCTDYRIMGKGEKHKMGMNEFNMSLQIPEMMGDIFAYYVGEQRAWAAVQKAELFNSDQSLEIGLVNESVEVEEVLPRAEKHLKKMINIHPPVYKNSKTYFRKGLLKITNRDIKEMLIPIQENANDPMTQNMIKMFMATLQSK